MPHARHSQRRRRASVEKSVRQAEALALRRQGLPQTEIAARLGVSTRTIKRDIDAALEQVGAQVAGQAEDLREKELARLERAWERMIETVESGGRQAVAAASVCVRISERRSRLLGLDEPTRHAHLVDPDAARREVVGLFNVVAGRLNLSSWQAEELARALDELANHDPNRIAGVQ